jgi:ketosteroid isomerase-like protein
MLVVAALLFLLPCLLMAKGKEKKSDSSKAAGAGSVEQAVEKFDEQFRDAALKSDTAFFEKNLADDYIVINPMGTATKQEVLDRYKSGQTKFDSIDVKDRKVRVYGNTAVVTAEADVKGRSAGSEMSGTYRSTRVLVKKNGQWQAVSFQTTKQESPPAK